LLTLDEVNAILI